MEQNNQLRSDIEHLKRALELSREAEEKLRHAGQQEKVIDTSQAMSLTLLQEERRQSQASNQDINEALRLKQLEREQERKRQEWQRELEQERERQRQAEADSRRGTWQDRHESVDSQQLGWTLNENPQSDGSDEIQWRLDDTLQTQGGFSGGRFSMGSQGREQRTSATGMMSSFEVDIERDYGPEDAIGTEQVGVTINADLTGDDDE